MTPEELSKICSGRNLRDWIAGEIMGRLLIGPWYVWLWRMLCKPASWIAAGILAVLMLFVGCANGPLSSCDEVVIEHHRKGGKISGKATWDDCRPLQPSLPALL